MKNEIKQQLFPQKMVKELTVNVMFVLFFIKTNPNAFWLFENKITSDTWQKDKNLAQFKIHLELN